MSDQPKTQFLKSEHNAGQITAYRVFDKRSGRSTTPLVMIQGLSAVGTVDYHDLAQSLSKKRTVVIFDNRDIGESTWQSDAGPMKPFTLQDLAMDVAHLIQVCLDAAYAWSLLWFSPLTRSIHSIWATSKSTSLVIQWEVSLV